MEKSFPYSHPLSVLTTEEAKRIWDLWVKFGGSRHGPHTETVSIPLAGFWKFVDAVIDVGVEFSERDYR